MGKADSSSPSLFPMPGRLIAGKAVSNELRRSLRIFDGLAMVIGIMVGAGIFRTPGLVARELGRPALTFVAWLLGGVLAFFGAPCFPELATRPCPARGK